MIPRDINEKLLESIPNIKFLFDSVVSWQDGIDTGSTVVVEDVFMVYLKEQLSDYNSHQINRCTAFIEWLAENSSDEYVGTVLLVSVFEYIHFADDRESLEKVLGPKALSKYQSISWNN